MSPDMWCSQCNCEHYVDQCEIPGLRARLEIANGYLLDLLNHQKIHAETVKQLEVLELEKRLAANIVDTLRDDLRETTALLTSVENDLEIAWSDCYDGKCDACPKCCDALRAQLATATERAEKLESNYLYAVDERDQANVEVTKLKARVEEVEHATAIYMNKVEVEFAALRAKLEKAREALGDISACAHGACDREDVDQCFAFIFNTSNSALSDSKEGT